MEKVDLRTADITQENIERLIELFPSVATETTDADGNVHLDIDLDALRELIGAGAEGQRERYQFTWPGKRAAKEEARRNVDKTLRPERELSVNWDDTQNLYIEGDNLDALKILRSTYAGKIKLIYIDPPYNTGHDFIYDDDFAQSRAEYDASSGEYDDMGGRLVANLEGNGRFHSDWCSMIYPRLLLARDLLANDGAIFISIDDHELTNLMKIMDEVFGKEAFICTFAVVNNMKGRNDKANYAPCHESLVVYAKRGFESYGLPLSEDKADEYDKTDEQGERYQLRDLRKRGNGDRREDRPNMYFPIYFDQSTKACSLEPIAGAIEITPHLGNGADGRWRWGKETVRDNLHLLEPKKKRDGSWGIEYRVYLNPRLNPTSQTDGDERREKPKSIWIGPEFSTDVAQRDLKTLFDGEAPFDFPKPLGLLKRIAQMALKDDELALDFFSGSGGFAQAIIETNFEDGGSRKFILVQIPEETTGEYSNLCEIGEERIRRAGAKIVAEVEEANRQLKLGEEPKPVPDVGFRVLRIDSSNFTDTYATPDSYDQDQLHLFEDNVKPDRSDLDLLFQVLPTLRIPYSATIEEIEVCGRRAFDVNHGQLVACFDVEVGADCIEQIAKMRPIYAVFRDASMADDATEANFEELFKTFSPDTVRKVI